MYNLSQPRVTLMRRDLGSMKSALSSITLFVSVGDVAKRDAGAKELLQRTKRFRVRTTRFSCVVTLFESGFDATDRSAGRVLPNALRAFRSVPKIVKL